jgi:CMP-N-acetylneuraminic acid synthetase
MIEIAEIAIQYGAKVPFLRNSVTANDHDYLLMLFKKSF